MDYVCANANSKIEDREDIKDLKASKIEDSAN